MTSPSVVRAGGIGCRRGCPAEAIRALLDEALAECGLGPEALHHVASVVGKGDEPALVGLAHALGLPLSLWSSDALRPFGARSTTASARVRAATGVEGVAEAAALAAVSDGDPDDLRAQLILPRRANDCATIALAGLFHDGVE